MSTPMMYALVGHLLSLPIKRDLSAVDPHVRKCLLEMIAHVEGGAPLVDCSNIWQLIRDDDAAKKGFLQEGIVAGFLRPFEGEGVTTPPMYKVAWKTAAFTCSFPESDASSLWVVQEASTTPGFGLYMLTVRNVSGKVEVRYVQEDGRDPEFPISRVTLALAAAKNASWVETGADRKTRKHSPAVAGIRFRHIEIDMGKAKTKSKLAPDYKSDGVPWHHRRGHWAYYGEDKPLFGRKGEHGWYWRPYMEVGDKKHGEIVQDYSIKANLPKDEAA